MKRIFNFSCITFVTMCLLVVFGTSCKTEDENKPKQLPILTTLSISEVTQSTATTGGSITSDNGLEVIARGVCWSLKPNPTINDSITKDAAGTGEFRSTLTNLRTDTTYYVRAYATNADGTAYGLQVTFRTLKAEVPVLTTTSVSSISETGAISGGSVVFDGGSPIVSRGLCWSTNENPSIDDNKSTDNGGIGVFSSTMTGLKAFTVYNVRAYATNKAGTGYGNVFQFITLIPSVSIPAGTFIMGSPETEVNRNSNETQHTVTLSAFRMSKYEITNAHYAAFLNAKSIGADGIYASGAYPTQHMLYDINYGSLDFGLHYNGTQWVPVTGYDNAPVTSVTWYGATEYATYIGGTLPTEAQWEYACRAGSTTTFNTGNFLTYLQANYLWEESYNGANNPVNTPSPQKPQTVGSYAANAFGLFDMHGNVCEWCSDWYGTYPTTAQTNPTGVTTGSERIIRGGGWDYFSSSCRSACRYSYPPNYQFYNIGFRVVFNQ